MAENESLDLTSPKARRWNIVRDAAQKGGSCQQVGVLTRQTFLRAIRKVLRQFDEHGVTVADFLARRGSPTAIKALLRQSKNHPYAELLVSVIESYPGALPTDCLHSWGHAILDTVFDQIGLNLGGSEVFPSFFDTHSYFRGVRDELRDELETVAARLADDPHWKPVVRAKKGEVKADPTASRMHMSLIGGPTR
jgi:hypothetical protein